jgi:hypothetical protein
MLREVSVMTERQLSQLRPLEVKRVRNYMALLGVVFEGDNGPALATEDLRDGAGEIVGHRVSVTDGSDDPIVRYLI